MALSLKEKSVLILKTSGEVCRDLYYQIKALNAPQIVPLPVKFFALVVVMIVLKENLKDLVGFHCPREHYEIYGSLYILGPAAISFFLAVLISESLREFFTGCCCWSCVQWKLFLVSSGPCAGHVLLSFLTIPLWIVCALMGGDYYACVTVGSDSRRSKFSSHDTGTDEFYSHERTDEFYVAEQYSRIFAWVLMISTAATLALLVVVRHFFIKRGKRKGEATIFRI